MTIRTIIEHKYDCAYSYVVYICIYTLVCTNNSVLICIRLKYDVHVQRIKTLFLLYYACIESISL